MWLLRPPLLLLPLPLLPRPQLTLLRRPPLALLRWLQASNSVFNRCEKAAFGRLFFCPLLPAATQSELAIPQACRAAGLRVGAGTGCPLNQRSLNSVRKDGTTTAGVASVLPGRAGSAVPGLRRGWG